MRIRSGQRDREDDPTLCEPRWWPGWFARGWAGPVAAPVTARHHRHQHPRLAAEPAGLVGVPGPFVFTRRALAFAGLRAHDPLGLRRAEAAPPRLGGTRPTAAPATYWLPTRAAAVGPGSTASALPTALSAERSAETAIASRARRAPVSASRSRARTSLPGAGLGASTQRSLRGNLPGAGQPGADRHLRPLQAGAGRSTGAGVTRPAPGGSRGGSHAPVASASR